MDMWTDERSMVSTLFVIRIQELDGSTGVHWVALLLLLFALGAQGGKRQRDSLEVCYFVLSYLLRWISPLFSIFERFPRKGTWVGR